MVLIADELRNLSCSPPLYLWLYLTKDLRGLASANNIQIGIDTIYDFDYMLEFHLQ